MTAITGGKQWALMHAVLAAGREAPSYERLAQIASSATRTVSNVLDVHGPEGTGLLTPGPAMRFSPGGALALGLSVGSQSVRGGLVDLNGELHHGHSASPMPEQLTLGPDVLFERVRSVAASVLWSAIEDKDMHARAGGELAMLGASISWPSPLDRAKCPRGHALRGQAWREQNENAEALPVPQMLSRHLSEPFTPERCHALHDANAHSLWVAFDESRRRSIDPGDTNQMWRVGLVIRIGESIGVSSILLAPPQRNRLSFIDSRLIEGTNGLAGELGHLRIDKRVIEEINESASENLAALDYERWRCSCGHKHHLEAFAGTAALVRRLRASSFEIPSDGTSQESLLQRARAGLVGDVVAHTAGIDVGRLVGHALAAPVLLLNPYSITVTGPLASDYVVKGMRRVEDAWASDMDVSARIGLDESEAGDYIGVRGAALAVIRRLVYRGFLDDRQGHLPATFPLQRDAVERLAERGTVAAA